MLSEDQLKRMRGDAKDVVNGFRTVRQQQARDVLELVAHIAALQHANELLVRKLEQPDLRRTDEPSFAQTFSDIFGNLNKKN
jgi:hypothetical protein